MAAWVLLPVVVLGFGLAYSPLLGRLTCTGDYSSGIYICAFPIQQTVLGFRPDIDLASYGAICSLLALLCAIASWHFIKKPSLALKRGLPAPPADPHPPCREPTDLVLKGWER